MAEYSRYNNENERCYILEGINTKEGIARFGGKQEKYFNALLSFASNLMVEDMLPFDLAVNDSNYEETRKMIHTLKGVAGNLSIYSIFEIAREFEKGLQKKEPDQKLYDQFISACKIEKEKILTQIAPKKELQPMITGSYEECMRLMINLKLALESLEAQACDEIVVKLKAKKWEQVDEKILASIYKNIENYMYDEAIDIIEGI